MVVGPLTAFVSIVAISRLLIPRNLKRPSRLNWLILLVGSGLVTTLCIAWESNFRDERHRRVSTEHKIRSVAWAVGAYCADFGSVPDHLDTLVSQGYLFEEAFAFDNPTAQIGLGDYGAWRVKGSVAVNLAAVESITGDCIVASIESIGKGRYAVLRQDGTISYVSADATNPLVKISGALLFPQP